jgi:hypothetical protein
MENIMKFIVVIPWTDTVEKQPRVTFGNVEARNLKHAHRLVDTVMEDKGALFDMMVGPGTHRKVGARRGTGPMASYGVSLGHHSIVPASDVGGLDLDWAMASSAL